MKPRLHLLSTLPGQLVLLGLLLVIGTYAIIRRGTSARTMPPPSPAVTVPGPQTFTRQGVRLEVPERKEPERTPPSRLARLVAPLRGAPESPAVSLLPLSLLPVAPSVASRPDTPFAPYGRMIPCETVVTIESNRLDTPVIGLVTEDVWSAGRVVIPAGAEVHGRASLDRARERLAVTGSWTIVWRDQSERNGSEVAVQGIALDRDQLAETWGLHDGSAGLRGEVVRSTDDRELKLFASTFLATATGALQGTASSVGILGNVSVPAATVRNATLAGTGAILREYADRMRTAIANDGFYLRIPAGKAFYLYVTQSIEPGALRPAGTLRTNEK
ncbi:MAG: TrbI/VirB10 family protein [Verrucomicrobia bacterium]|nr:TrbI/VirB10 family protein [Verrucomicrobiota bacterium]